MPVDQKEGVQVQVIVQVRLLWDTRFAHQLMETLDLFYSRKSFLKRMKPITQGIIYWE